MNKPSVTDFFLVKYVFIFVSRNYNELHNGRTFPPTFQVINQVNCIGRRNGDSGVDVTGAPNCMLVEGAINCHFPDGKRLSGLWSALGVPLFFTGHPNTGTGTLKILTDK